MAELVEVNPPGALERLGPALREYQKISGRNAVQVLVQKGGQLLHGNQNPKFGKTFPGLTQLFMRERPRDGEIYAAARSRGFRLGRRTLGRGELSPTALHRAEKMMGGYKSILVSGSGLDLNFVRIGKRGRRVRFRHGRESSAVSGAGVGRLRPDEKRLNLRAVASYFELKLRETGRFYLGASWLFRRWRAFAKHGYVPAGTPGLRAGWGPSRQFGGTDWRLENRNPRAQIQLLGDAQLRSTPDRGEGELRITSRIPGVLTIGRDRGLFSRAIDSVVTDIETYLARKQREEGEAALRQFIRA